MIFSDSLGGLRRECVCKDGGDGRVSQWWWCALWSVASHSRNVLVFGVFFVPLCLFVFLLGLSSWETGEGFLRQRVYKNSSLCLFSDSRDTRFCVPLCPGFEVFCHSSRVRVM